MKFLSHPKIQVARAASRAALLLLAVTVLSSDLQAAGHPHLPPGLALGRRARGEDAIALLGSRLPAVAAAYGLRDTELSEHFKKHQDLWVDSAGALLYVCEGLSVSDTLAAGSLASGSTTELVAASPSSAFTLHSTPGATRVIYLDFTGHVTSGTYWNSSFNGGANITSQPFDLDGNPGSFSDAECAFIHRVWQRVAEDFAPFAVDVTTEDPGLEALRNSGTGDTSYGQRVVISPSNWYNTGAGGVAYIGSFNWSSDTPNFVFTQQLANGEKYIAEAISHETGHALGLNHEGQTGSSPTEYYAGHGDWAPIMGNSYYRPITQWCKGEYVNANNTQDQLAVMQNYGAPLIANTHGNSLATATPVSGLTFTIGGTIMTRTDVDIFRFNTGAGAISFNVVDLTPEPNMNMNVQLLNASGAVVQTGIPSVTSVTVASVVPAGTYYLKINGTGSGDPATNGYSNYASLGDYVATGVLVSTGTNQAPTAVAAATPTAGTAPLPVNFSSAGSIDSDGSIVSYAWNFGDGSTSNEAHPSHVYSSAGNYTATLTVTDNGNLSSTANVAITVTTAVNQSPVAIASGTPTSGIAPLPVAFSSAGSSDPDGSIVSYAWNFGDGSTSTAASPIKTYNTAGTYTARLTVTDDRGATSSATVSIVVSPAPADPNTDVDVSQFGLTSSKAASGSTATATIFVKDRLGRAAANVTVNVKWSGLVSGTATGKTDGSGRVVFTSGKSKKSGTVSATITAITPAAGVVYDAAIYSAPLVSSVNFN
jgi:PKD repeat protein